MDPANAPAYILFMPTGAYSLLGFYTEFIQANTTSGVAAQEAYIAPLLNWYRVACTNYDTSESAIAVNLVTSALLLQAELATPRLGLMNQEPHEGCS
jgi:hypothetical protein